MSVSLTLLRKLTAKQTSNRKINTSLGS